MPYLLMVSSAIGSSGSLQGENLQTPRELIEIKKQFSLCSTFENI